MPFPPLSLRFVVSALVGGFFGRSALAVDDKIPDYKTFAAALDAIEANYIGTVRIRQPRLQRDSRHARHARSAFELLRSESLRADARASGRPLLRPRHPDSEHARGRHRRDRRVRRIARVQEGRAARRRVRANRGRKRQGLDDRAGDAEAPRSRRERRCTSSCRRRGYEQIDSARRDARRSLHPHRARHVHVRFDHRLHQAAGFRREHRPRPQARAARPDEQGDEAARARYPRQPRRSARSGDQGDQRVPAEGQDDRLHARPQSRTRTRITARPRTASSPTCRL